MGQLQNSSARCGKIVENFAAYRGHPFVSKLSCQTRNLS